MLFTIYQIFINDIDLLDKRFSFLFRYRYVKFHTTNRCPKEFEPDILNILRATTVEKRQFRPVMFGLLAHFPPRNVAAFESQNLLQYYTQSAKHLPRAEFHNSLKLFEVNSYRTGDGVTVLSLLKVGSLLLRQNVNNESPAKTRWRTSF